MNPSPTRARALLAALFLFASAHAAPAPIIPLEVLFADAEMAGAQISPTGRYLTWLAPKNQRMNLAILDRETKKVRWLTDMKLESVVSFMWAKPDRLLFAQQYGGREQYGMFACDPDGKNLVVINKLERVEADADGAGQGDIPAGERDLPKSLISLLPKDPDHILMNRVRGNSFLGDVWKVNLRTGREMIEERNYIGARVWIADSEGVVRVAICTDFEEPVRVKYRRDAKSEWRTLGEFSRETSMVFEEASPIEAHWRPSVFAKDNRTLYVKTFVDHDRSALRTLDPETGAWGPVLFAHERVEAGDRLANYRRGGLSSRAALDGLIFNSAGEVAGVAYEDDYPEVTWLDPQMEKIARDIDRALPGTRNAITSTTRDGQLMIVRAASDRDPGAFYLYDAKKQEMAEIGRVRPKIEPKHMAEMRPIRFPARDGLEIPGYITVPAGRELKRLPMILVPHGGPYGPRDTWGFQDQVQYLANRGYAVLQVNYRGSGGYGLAFQRAGYREWGGKMQDDLSDAVKWCVAQGYADPARVGVFGASYGGYAVLAGLTLTPELYCCGVDYVGVADLESRGGRGGGGFVFPRIIRETRSIVNLDPVKDAALVRAVNPVEHVAAIRAPLFAAYGKNDPRVRFDQWQVLEARLKQHGKEYEVMIEENEGHGFRKLENKLEFYRRVEAFLAKNMNVPDGRVKVGTPVTVPDKTKAE
ncbi:MAG: S9 family peptidase [Opitutus sp.]|nr:S9 family peptidase [Opitutus sp.]